MIRWTMATLVCAFLMASIASLDAATIGAIGDGGWYSDDTRYAGADLVGVDFTHAGKPGQTPSSSDDSQIAQQIQFVADAPGSTQALKLSFDASVGSGKATLSVVNTDAGFATDNWSDGFFANFRRYRETTTNTTLKIGVQSTDWALSQDGFTATRSGESTWDLILVYTGNYTPFQTWESISLTDAIGNVTTELGTESSDTRGTWQIYAQAGNSHFTRPTANKTLAGWYDDPVWGPLLFGAGAKVTNIQLGGGAFGVSSVGYFDYFETSLINGGERIEFVPEPGTIGLLAFGGLALAGAAMIRRRKRQR